MNKIKILFNWRYGSSGKPAKSAKFSTNWILKFFVFFVCSLHIIFSSQSVCRFVYESVIPKIKSKKSAVRPSVNSKWIAVSCGFIIFIWIPSIDFIVASKTFYYADFAIRHFVRLCHAFAVIDLFATIVPRSDAFCQADSNVSFLTILYLFSLYFIGFITAFLHNSSVSVTIRFLKKKPWYPKPDTTARLYVFESRFNLDGLAAVERIRDRIRNNSRLRTIIYC